VRILISLLVLALVSIVVSQDRLGRIDFVLEYLGTVTPALVFNMKAQSEVIRTLIDVEGDINYEIQQRFIGPVSYLNGTGKWVTEGQSLTGNFQLTFGGSHVTQDHVLNLVSLGNVYLLPAHPDVITYIGQFNVTSGLGAFQGATGGITVNGYQDNMGQATWLISGVFWVVPTPPPFRLF